MEDLELLDLAAKAAGIHYDPGKSQPNPKSGAWWGLWLVYDDQPSEHARRHWNPLRDDGDALRLAVTLNISAGNPGMRLSIDWRAGDDPYATTRRVIVRAAAEMGKVLAGD